MNYAAKKYYQACAFLMVMFAFAFPALATTPTGPDLTPLTAQIDWTTVITAILAAAAAAILVILTMKGVKYIYNVIRGA
ncbi:MAG TPA: hypothetical protein VK642_13150 [Burkholderiales bacterium]|nr:hypothetical protein [Burkholderiales bacterium]